MIDQNTVKRSGFVAVIGRPNAGKSTLVNYVVGKHVAIVSPIAQTTRRVVRAAITHADTQIVFVDLPGSQRPIDRMTARMQQAVEHSFNDVDVILWILDVTQSIGKGEKQVAKMALESKLPVVIALNKIDRVKPQKIAEQIVEVSQLVGNREYAAIVPISSSTGDGIDSLIEEVKQLLPEGPAWFDKQGAVDMRQEERIAEYVREAALQFLRDELPHATAVTVDDLIHDDNRLHVSCTIWVEKESQVGILVGKGGNQIRDLGISARKVIEKELEEKVHLELRVKVRKSWRDDEAWLGRAGL